MRAHAGAARELTPEEEKWIAREAAKVLAKDAELTLGQKFFLGFLRIAGEVGLPLQFLFLDPWHKYVPGSDELTPDGQPKIPIPRRFQMGYASTGPDKGDLSVWRHANEGAQNHIPKNITVDHLLNLSGPSPEKPKPESASQDTSLQSWKEKNADRSQGVLRIESILLSTYGRSILGGVRVQWSGPNTIRFENIPGLQFEAVVKGETNQISSIQNLKFDRSSRAPSALTQILSPFKLPKGGIQSLLNDRQISEYLEIGPDRIVILRNGKNRRFEIVKTGDKFEITLPLAVDLDAEESKWNEQLEGKFNQPVKAESGVQASPNREVKTVSLPQGLPAPREMAAPSAVDLTKQLIASYQRRFGPDSPYDIKTDERGSPFLAGTLHVIVTKRESGKSLVFDILRYQNPETRQESTQIVNLSTNNSNDVSGALYILLDLLEIEMGVSKLIVAQFSAGTIDALIDQLVVTRITNNVTLIPGSQVRARENLLAASPIGHPPTESLQLRMNIESPDRIFFRVARQDAYVTTYKRTFVTRGFYLVPNSEIEIEKGKGYESRVKVRFDREMCEMFIGSPHSIQRIVEVISNRHNVRPAKSNNIQFELVGKGEGYLPDPVELSGTWSEKEDITRLFMQFLESVREYLRSHR